MEGARRTTFACIRWLHTTLANKISGRCVTPIDRVLGTAVEATPNENRRQSSQRFGKDVGGFRLVVAGCTKPFEPTRHQLLGKLVRTTGYAGKYSPRDGKQPPSVWLDAS